MTRNDRLPTFHPDPAWPQDTTVDNLCRQTTSANRTDRHCRSLLFGYAQGSTADHNCAHQSAADGIGKSGTGASENPGSASATGFSRCQRADTVR